MTEELAGHPPLPELPPKRNPTARNPFNSAPLYDGAYLNLYAVKYARLALQSAAPAPAFVLRTPEGDDGQLIFEVNGVEVGRTDHDSAGWQGMEDQQNMFKKIAAVLGVRVRHIDAGEDVGFIE